MLTRKSIRRFAAQWLFVIAGLAISSAFAAIQPLMPSKVTITPNEAGLGSLGSKIVPQYLNRGGDVLISNVVSAGTVSSGGPLTLMFSEISFAVVSPGFSLLVDGLSFDVGTKSLIGNVFPEPGYGPPVNYRHRPILLARNVSGWLGADLLTAVSNATAPRPISFTATDFSLAPEFLTYFGSIGYDTKLFTSPLGASIEKIEVRSVPEPDVCILVGAALGLLAVAGRRCHR